MQTIRIEHVYDISDESFDEKMSQQQRIERLLHSIENDLNDVAFYEVEQVMDCIIAMSDVDQMEHTIIDNDSVEVAIYVSCDNPYVYEAIGRLQEKLNIESGVSSAEIIELALELIDSDW